MFRRKFNRKGQYCGCFVTTNFGSGQVILPEINRWRFVNNVSCHQSPYRFSKPAIFISLKQI